MSLRNRLLVGLVFVAVVLVAADGVLGATLDSYLVGRVDQQLETSFRPLARNFGVPPRGRSTVVPGGTAAFGGSFSAPDREGSLPSTASTSSSVPTASTSSTPSTAPGTVAATSTSSTVAPSPPASVGLTEFYVEIFSSTGKKIRAISPQLPVHAEAPPILTSAEVVGDVSGVGARYRPFTAASSVKGGAPYRAIAVRQGETGDIVVTALSLATTLATFHRMLMVEAGATVLVLAALALVAWWFTRGGIRPIDEMAATASAIAAGDLSRRVARAEPRTETGRLGMALNSMLGQIEEAFDERRSSEDRLRRFVADASHELRTPLTSIRGYVELWRQGGLADTDQLSDAMRRMEQEASRMGVLVDDLLLLARLDQHQALLREPVDLTELTTDAVRDAQAVEPDRPITLSVADDGFIGVYGDDHRLRQVLANLLDNVRIHTPPEAPVEVCLYVDGGSVVIEVTDHGPGLDGEQAARVFERFYRADPARSHRGNGSGLGLSIVEAVAEAHGGSASVRSVPGEGTTFEVRLPLARSTEAPPD